MGKIEDLNARCSLISPSVRFVETEGRWELVAKVPLNPDENEAQVLLDAVLEALEPWLEKDRRNVEITTGYVGKHDKYQYLIHTGIFASPSPRIGTPTLEGIKMFTDKSKYNPVKLTIIEEPVKEDTNE